MRYYAVYWIFLSKLLLILLFSCENKVGLFQSNQDIGNPALKGEAKFDKDSQIYTLKGAGYNIWFDRDEFHFLFNELEGDFKLTAEMALVGDGVDPHRKIGIMVRESLSDSAAHVSATIHGDGLTLLQWRRAHGQNMRDPEDEIFAEESHYDIIQMERKGNRMTMRAAKRNFQNMETIGSYEAENIPKKALVGLFICSHNPEVLEEARFWNLSIE